MNADWLIENVNIATLDKEAGASYGAIEDGLLAVRDGKICWVGKREAAPNFHHSPRRMNGNGRWLTPGLIDCHTHLVYGGNRAKEFEARLLGVSYEDIAKQGGGIVSTVKATREASEEALLDSATKRLSVLFREGVTTVEIKSGYGLDLNSEMKMLQVVRALAGRYPLTVSATFLGAHAIPLEYKGKADEYIDLVCQEMLPAIAERGLADAVDVFCEGIGFSVEQCRRVYDTARRLGLPVKGHVEQLSYLGGAKLVAEFDGLSVDHIEYLVDDDVAMLSDRGVVPVLLPSAFYFLKETTSPPLAALRDHKLDFAIATDLNPGSSPSASLLLAMNQACVLFGCTPEESLTGVTRAAAKALGLEKTKGQLKLGYDADILLWDIAHPAELSYAVNMNLPLEIWIHGKCVGGHGKIWAGR